MSGIKSIFSKNNGSIFLLISQEQLFHPIMGLESY